MRLPSPVPESLRGFVVAIHDGKSIKGLPKRLKATRGSAGGLQGGKALVALRLDDGLVATKRADPDGEADEPTMLEGHLERVRSAIPGPVPHVLDRNFSSLHLLRSRAGVGRKPANRSALGGLEARAPERGHPVRQADARRQVWVGGLCLEEHTAGW